MRKGMLAIIIIMCSVIIGLLSYYMYQPDTSDSAELVDKVFKDSEKIVDPTPKVEDGVGGIQQKEMQEIKPSLDPDPVVVGKEPYTDEDTSKLWFDVRNSDLGLEQRIAKIDILVESLKQVMLTGKTPSVVHSFQDPIVVLDDYGFSKTHYTYPNGYVEIITMVLPELGQGVQRVKQFFVITVEDKTYVKVFDDMNLLPNDFATLTGDDNYLMISGSVLNEKVRTSVEDQQVVLLKIEADKVTVLDMSSIVGQIGDKHLSANKGLLYVEGSDSAPYFYSEIVVENRFPEVLYAIIPGEVTSKTFKIGFGDGLPVAELVSEE